MCPITTVRIERGTPIEWKRRSNEIPNTTNGITSGLRRSAETGRLAPEAAADEGDRGEDPEHDRAEARERGNDGARLQRALRSES